MKITQHSWDVRRSYFRPFPTYLESYGERFWEKRFKKELVEEEDKLKEGIA
jgi:hypothetical protein